MDSVLGERQTISFPVTSVKSSPTIRKPLLAFLKKFAKALDSSLYFVI